jgi:hypothetical protein
MLAEESAEIYYRSHLSTRVFGQWYRQHVQDTIFSSEKEQLACDFYRYAQLLFVLKTFNTSTKRYLSLLYKNKLAKIFHLLLVWSRFMKKLQMLRIQSAQLQSAQPQTKIANLYKQAVMSRKVILLKRFFHCLQKRLHRRHRNNRILCSARRDLYRDVLKRLANMKYKKINLYQACGFYLLYSKKHVIGEK